MKIRKVGECLTYGLVHELSNNNEKKYSYLRAVVVFLILHGYVDRRRTLTFQQAFDSSFGMGNELLTLEKVLGMLAESLKDRFQFSNFEELTGELNQLEVPKWIYDNGEVILNMLPEAYLVDDVLYYIDKRNGRYLFRRVEAEKIEYMFNFDVYDVETDDDGEFDIISNRYSGIIGFNEEMRIFYLRHTHLDEVYVEYHIDSFYEVIIHKRCLGTIGGRLPIVIKDNQLCVMVGDVEKVIKKVNFYENYGVRENEIYVMPGDKAPAMFKPYVISLNAGLTRLPYNEIKSYLWDMIVNSIMPSFIGVDIRSVLKQDKEKFSLKFLEDFMNDESISFNKNGRILDFIVKILGKYLPKEEDVLDYFYVIAEAARRYEKNVSKNVLSERVYWRLEELEVNGELETCIYDLNAFKEKLLEYAYWSDERITEMGEDKEIRGRVGGFEIVEGEIEAVSVPLEKGKCIGSMVMMPEVYKQGMVTYNVDCGVFEIQFSRRIDDVEREKIVNCFNLKEGYYRFFVEVPN